MKKKSLQIVAFIAALTVLAVPAAVFAANTPNLTQTINAGTLNVDILDSSRVAVASPTFALGASTFSFNCQTVTGTLGDNNNRIYATNPGADNNGFTIGLAGSATTATWTAGGNKYDFNDATAACGDSADTDTVGGQLTVDPSVETLTADYTSGNVTGITKGSSTAYSEVGTIVSSVQLINAAAGSDDAGRWYITGAGLSQTIPAQTPVGAYSLGMVLTITGN
jgi:hypothetical protein